MRCRLGLLALGCLLAGITAGDDVVEMNLIDDRMNLRASVSKIRIRLRPDYSGAGSTTFVRQLAEAGKGGDFQFYRAETWGVLQGSMSNPDVPVVVSKGPCPKDVDGAAIYAKRECFPHDPQCACHGPSFVQGMVGWAGGRGGGPDFFIYTGDSPADHWSHDHTVWGELADAESLALVKQVLQFPTSDSGMAMLKDKISFRMHSDF
jgi:hypothetical protein